MLEGSSKDTLINQFINDSEYFIFENGNIYDQNKIKLKNYYDLNCDSFIEYKNKRLLVSRIVFTKFKGHIPEGHKVSHRDKNKLNNSITNLYTRNLKLKNFKLNEDQVLEIKKHLKANLSISDISKIFNVSISTIQGIKNGTKWAKVVINE